jgi:hypothetical protein
MADLVCNGYPSGRGAEVSGFNAKARLWLKENVKSGHWIIPEQCVQIPIEDVSQLLAKAAQAGLEVKTNNL